MTNSNKICKKLSSNRIHFIFLLKVFANYAALATGQGKQFGRKGRKE